MRLLSLHTHPSRADLDDLVDPESGSAAIVPVDAYRVEDSLVLRCDLPGVDPDSVILRLSDRRLDLQARRFDPTPSSDVFLSERFRGLLCRSVDLPVDVDASSALADFDEGILTVTLPIVEEVRCPLSTRHTLSGPEEAVPERPTLPFSPRSHLLPAE